jgi:limonene-1,2-epoxide hydrolase
MDAMPTEPERVVAQLALALDRDDFPAAAACLAPDCEYETGRETLHGPAAIIASYAAASAWARRALDDVRYESAVEPARGNVVPVRFTDYLMKAGGRWHRHRCVQEFEVGAAGLIVRIVHVELPGEREALDAYFLALGIERASQG